MDILVSELEFELQDELVDHHRDNLRRQIAEGHGGIEALRNSGANMAFTASSPASSLLMLVPKPMPSLAMSLAPALVVMIRMTFRKSTVLP